jgi:hypothetical protein
MKKERDMRKKVFAFVGIVVFFFGSFAIASAQGHSDIIQICIADSNQGYVQTAYDPNHDAYLVVWEDNRNGNNNTDVYGQFVDGNGTLIGQNFSVCSAVNPQWWPHLDFDPNNNRFLVVFEDNRNGNDQGDIRGVFIDSDGNCVDAPTSGADHTFGICTEMYDIYTCSVAFNYLENVYLVVWGDSRAQGDTWIGERWGVDIYGQLVSSDGTLVSPSDPTVNFPIDQAEWYEASVPDVTYNDITNEFFVVYGTEIGYVLGQRVSHTGQLINPDGTTGVIAKSSSVTSVLPAMLISQNFENGPDCFQAKVDSRTEYGVQVAKTSAESYTEVQVVWKSQIDGMMEPYNDVYGQRIGFFWEDDKYVAHYVNLDGDTTSNVSNFLISTQEGPVDMPDLAYSAQDNEHLVGWGDPRNYSSNSYDLYVQRLWINEDENMIFLADDRVNTVTNTENIPVCVTSNYEGGILGVAHSSVRNEFLVAYEFRDYSLARDQDVYGIRFYGSEPSTNVPLSSRSGLPGDFQITQNYPNPFNPETTIEFSLPVQSRVMVEVFDLLGRQIQTLFDGMEDSGTHQVSWNGKDESGAEVSSGVYFYQMRTEQFSAKKKMLLIR